MKFAETAGQRFKKTDIGILADTGQELYPRALLIGLRMTGKKMLNAYTHNAELNRSR